jgi:hypothetical protein
MAAFLSYLKRKSLKIFFTCLAMFLIIISRAQQKTLFYDIVKNDEVIGHLVLYKTIDGNKTLYQLKSSVNTKFVFSYSINISETVVFENGLMIYSFFHEMENGKETFVETKLSGNNFQFIKNGKVYSEHNTRVFSNILQLYTNAPSADTEAFSNHFQQLVNVKKISENRYVLSLPGGHNNYYHYKKGVCTQIDVVRTLFRIHIVLKKQVSS